MMNKFNYSIFEKIVGDINKKVVGNRIGNFTIINSRDFLISFTAAREEKLLVSLNHQNPFICYIGVDESIPTIVGKTNDTLRRELKDALILGVEILNEDKILVFHMQKTNDYFEREKKDLIIELIPQRTNMILTNGEGTVIFALNYSPLESVRPVLRNLSYIAPNKREDFVHEKVDFDMGEFKNSAQEYLYDAIHKRLMERYEILFKHIKSRTKSQKAKIKVLEKEIETARDNLRYQDIGNMVLALSDDLEQLKDYLKDNNVELNTAYTLGQNANLFFKKYKKAKRTIEMDGIELEKAKNEISKYESISAQVNYMNDDDLYELAMELIPGKFTNKDKKNTKTKLSYITVDGTRIYFGKNAKQNNEITFKLAKPNNTYLHIKDYHGSHVLIENDKPTKEQLLVASEMCLILSNKEAGDIMYTPITLVKKGTTLGEALLKTYQTITLTSVREKTKHLLHKFEGK